VNETSRFYLFWRRAPGHALAQRGPGEAPERLPAEAGRGMESFIKCFFGCFRDLSYTMRRDTERKRGYTWFCTSMHRPDRRHEEYKIIRKNPTWK